MAHGMLTTKLFLGPLRQASGQKLILKHSPSDRHRVARGQNGKRKVICHAMRTL